MLYGIKLKL